MNADTCVTLITHTDLDGAGCAVLMRRAFGSHLIDTFYVDYDNVDKFVCAYISMQEETVGAPHMLVITDICPSEETMALLVSKADELDFQVVIVDHHKTSAIALRNYGECVCYNANKCGTLLVAEWLDYCGLLVDRNVSMQFAKIVDAYDRWVLTSPFRVRAEGLNRLFYFLGRDKFVAAFVTDMYSDVSHTHRYTLDTLISNEERKVEQAVSLALRDENIFRDSASRQYVLFVATGLMSQIGNAILETDSSIDYVVMIVPSRNELSFRSRQDDGVDVSEIAKRLGGGGHKAAAGCKFPLKKSLQTLITELF